MNNPGCDGSNCGGKVGTDGSLRFNKDAIAMDAEKGNRGCWQPLFDGVLSDG